MTIEEIALFEALVRYRDSLLRSMESSAAVSIEPADVVRWALIVREIDKELSEYALGFDGAEKLWHE